MNIQSLIRTKPRYCRHCDVVVLSSGIRKRVSEMTFLKEEEQQVNYLIVTNMEEKPIILNDISLCK